MIDELAKMDAAQDAAQRRHRRVSTPIAPPIDPRIDLASLGWIWRGYQVRYLRDRSRLKAVLKARQIGMSETLAFEAAVEALVYDQPVYLVSTNYRKAKDLLAKVVRWLKIIVLAAPALAPYGIESVTTERVALKSSVQIQALPCTPSAVRGETGVVVLDEVDHYPRLWEIYEAIAPAIASSPALRLIASSTPLGEDGLLFKIFESDFGAKWSKHKITVYDAVADGFNEEVLDLRPIYTSDAWAQEFECEFVSDRERYFSNAWLRFCGGIEFDGVPIGYSVGLDVGRTRDRSALSHLGFYNSHNASIVPPIDIIQATNHAKQFDEINAAISRRYGKSAPFMTVDATGEGSGLADFLVHHHGSRLVERYTASAKSYAEHIPNLLLAGERGELAIPNDPILHAAFSKVKKVVTASGISYKADRDSDGHADPFFGVLLAHQRFWRPPHKRSPGVAQTASVTRPHRHKKY